VPFTTHFANKETLLKAIYEAGQAGVAQEIVADALAALGTGP
jgi:hypothetical protein